MYTLTTKSLKGNRRDQSTFHYIIAVRESIYLHWSQCHVHTWKVYKNGNKTGKSIVSLTLAMWHSFNIGQFSSDMSGMSNFFLECVHIYMIPKSNQCLLPKSVYVIKQGVWGKGGWVAYWLSSLSTPCCSSLSLNCRHCVWIPLSNIIPLMSFLICCLHG